MTTEWKACASPEETAILANMHPDREYTAASLAEICNTSRQKVSAVLRAVAKGGGGCAALQKSGRHRLCLQNQSALAEF